MPNPTPGQIAYAAFWHNDATDHYDAWALLPPQDQARWEAAAQAVRAMQEAPPRRWTPQPLHTEEEP